MSLLTNKSFFLTLLVVVASLAYSQAQLTESNQEALKNMAKQEVQRILSEFKQPEKDLQQLTEACLALEILEDLPQADQVCKVIKKYNKELLGQDEQSVNALYHLAQIQRLFKCDHLKSIPTKFNSLITSKPEHLSNPTSIYYVYQILKNAKEFGIKEGNSTFLADQAKAVLTQAFVKADWSLNGQKGITFESLRAAKVLASLSKHKEVGSEATGLLKGGLQKLAKQFVVDGETFSFITSNSDKKELDSTELNLYILQIIDLLGESGAELTKDQIVGLRNFFLQRAKLSSSVRPLLQSLRGLKRLIDVPVLKQEAGKSAVSASDAKASVKYEFLDNFGNQFTANSTKVSLVQVDGNKVTKDITPNTKLNKDKNSATLTLTQQEIGKYKVVFTIGDYSLFLPLTVTDSLKITSASYQVTTSSSFPSKLDSKVEYPKQITGMTPATDGSFIHMSVSASFATVQGQAPSQVYLAIRKLNSVEKNLFINSYAKLNGNKYQITLDVSKDMEHLNGDYEMALHVADYRADKKQVWQLGNIRIWFKEGQDEGTNNGVKEEFRPQSHIEFVLPPPEKDISPIVPFLMVGALALLFIRYFAALTTNKANLSRLNFSGFLFIIVFLVILGIFTMFWVEVKLTSILWILLFFSPIALIISYQALQQADCAIGEFKAPTSSKKRID